VLHVYGLTGGVEVTRCTKEGRLGWLYLLGMCSAASDTDVLAEVPDTPEGVAILDFVAPATPRAISGGSDGGTLRARLEFDLLMPGEEHHGDLTSSAPHDIAKGVAINAVKPNEHAIR
jgi:hypothetical protein